MSGRLAVGIDIGTTAIKVAVVDPVRGVVAESQRRSVLSSPHPGWAEADPGSWWQGVREALREAVSTTEPNRIGALAVSGMVPALVCVDEDNRPVRAAILQNDIRAGVEVQHLSGALADLDVLHATGSPLTQQSIAPTALWLAEHEPEVWARTKTILGSYDWVLTMLGAPAHVERNWAIESGLFALGGEPFRPVLDAVPGLEARLPPVADGGQAVGTLRADLAREAGLPAGVDLVVGGADHVLSALGAGLTEPGDWLVKIGGAGDILVVSDRPAVDARFYLDAHPVPDLWLPNGCMATSGSLVRWVQGILGIDDLAAMDAVADRREAASVLCLPYFLGEKSPLNDPDLRGVFAGMHIGHTREDLYRAALEGIAFAFRHNTEAFVEQGLALERATITNGGATSMLWKRIHASVLGVPLRTVVGHPGAALGAGLLALGGREALDVDAIAAMVAWGPVIDPEPALVARYDDVYPIWRELGLASAPSMRAFARS